MKQLGGWSCHLLIGSLAEKKGGEVHAKSSVQIWGLPLWSREFELSISHVSGAVEWPAEYAHLELWREAKAGDWHLGS